MTLKGRQVSLYGHCFQFPDRDGLHKKEWQRSGLEIFKLYIYA